MWQQNYTPIADSLALSALIAAVPIFVLLFLIGIRRKPAWIASLAGLGATVVLAAVVYRMPLDMLAASVGYGAGFGTPVAVAATMLTGLGFSPFTAAAVCLLANTAPVAFGSIATPIITLARTTQLPLDRLSAGVG